MHIRVWKDFITVISKVDKMRKEKRKNELIEMKSFLRL